MTTPLRAAPTNFSALIEESAHAHGLDHRLVTAVVLVESGGNQFAWNPEPVYRYFWDVKHGRPFRAVTPDELRSERPPADFPTLAGDPDQEWWAQQASWGLMQVMGAVARELGFQGPYLTQLCSAQTNLGYGCRKLNADLKWSGGDLEKALMAYNGGRGSAVKRTALVQRYAAKVLKQLATVTGA